MLLSRKQIAKNNAANYQATKHAKVVKKFETKKGTVELSQRSTGDWLAEFTANDTPQRYDYKVAIGDTPKQALKRLKIDTTPV